MNAAIGTLVDADGDLKIMTNNGLQVLGGVTANTAMNGNWVTTQVMPSVSGGVTLVKPDDVLEKYEFNQFVVEHKVQEQELIKLKEENVNYAELIKENMAKNCAREFVKKLSFSKKHDKDLDVHSFRGRVWVFTREELVQLIDDVKQGKV